MSDLDQIVAHVPVDQIATALDVDPSQVSAAVREALPALLGQMAGNIEDPDGAHALASALADHVEASTDFDSIDPAEGSKIVRHVLGSDPRAAMATGSSNSLIEQVLPYLAPIVMAYLAKQATSRAGGGALGSVLSDVLSDAPGSSTGSSKSSGGILGQILSSVFKR